MRGALTLTCVSPGPLYDAAVYHILDVDPKLTEDQYSALTNSTSHTTTTCPVIGPTSSASLPGYTYLSTYPDPLSCYAACQAAEQGVTLLQPGLSGYSCACADSIEGEGYTEVCNSQSWYVVVEAQKGAEDGSRRRRALRTANMASPAR